MTAPATTIKVPTRLRDQLNREARASGTTVAGVIEQLIASRDRAELFRRMREERAALPPAQRDALTPEFTDFESAALADLSDGDD